MLPLALYAYIAERNSWRPKTIVVAPGRGINSLEFSPNGKYIFASNCNSYGYEFEYFVCEFTTRRCRPLSVVLQTPFLFLDKNHVVGWTREQINKSKIIAGISPLFGDMKLVSPPANFMQLGALPNSKTLIGFLIKNPDIDSRYELWTWKADSTNAPQTCFRFKKERANTDHVSFWSYFPLQDGRHILILHANARYEIFDVFSKTRRFVKLDQHKKYAPVASMANGLVFLLSNKGTLETWDYKTLRLLKTIQCESYPKSPPNKVVSEVAFSAASNLMIMRNNGTEILMWETNTGKLIRRIKTKKLSHLTFSPDGRTLATGHYDGTIQLWRIK